MLCRCIITLFANGDYGHIYVEVSLVLLRFTCEDNHYSFAAILAFNLTVSLYSIEARG